MKPNSLDHTKEPQAHQQAPGMDYFLYSGPIERRSDLEFIKLVSNTKASDKVTLILCTNGGDPDAAYKIGKYLQKRYDDVTVLVAGLCKSAGTLLAIAANELAFTPFAELGPLDIQLTRRDDIMGMDSGLNIIEALSTLEYQARNTFNSTIGDVIAASGGVVSFATAAHSASELVNSIYSPMFAQIDPEEVGSRSRAMRIGEDYGRRLNQKFMNLRDQDAMMTLSQSYPSHAFVIDMDEACHLFNRVREATDDEKYIADSLGQCCRFPEQRLHIRNISDVVAGIKEGTTANENRRTKAAGEAESGGPDGGNPAPATKADKIPPGAQTAPEPASPTGS